MCFKQHHDLEKRTKQKQKQVIYVYVIFTYVLQVTIFWCNDSQNYSYFIRQGNFQIAGLDKITSTKFTFAIILQQLEYQITISL